MSEPTLSPPGAELDLVPPSPVAAVAPERARTLIPIAPETVGQLEERASEFAASVLDADPNAPDFQKKVTAVTTLGDREIRAASQVSNRMLERPVSSMDEAGLLGDKSPIGKSLVDLRQTIDDLDPSRQGLLAPKKLFGIVPFGDRLRDYFDKYRSSQSHIDGIMRALLHGEDELRKDNAAIEQEKVSLWTAMGQLQQYAVMCEHLDAELETRIGAIEASDPERASQLRQDVLFLVRQKHQDLLTQLAVSTQGYMALELVKKNNVELVKGVERATTTTIAALRTAVLVAQALANQKLVLDQITALNTTTSNLIESTSVVLRDQTARVHEQASTATIDINQLKAAFSNIYATMDAIDTFKLQALDNMKLTVGALTDELGKAQAYLERTGGPGENAGGPLALPA